jgi:hypothetical protein
MEDTMENVKLSRGMVFTARHTMAIVDGGYRFQFFCSLCDGGYATGLIKADSVEAALQVAEKESRPFFNGCCQCGKWVCDYHYNMQEALCAACAPLAAGSDHLEYLRDRDKKRNGRTAGLKDCKTIKPKRAFEHLCGE